MRGLCADSARQFWTVRQSAAACPIFRHTVKAGTVSACCGWCGDKFGPNFDNFFWGFLLLHASLMMPWMCPVCWFARGRSRSAHKDLKRVKKELKTGQKRTQNGPKKNENLIFWKLIFGVLHVRNDKIRCLTERISLIRRRWCAMREQVIVFLGTPTITWITQSLS